MTDLEFQDLVDRSLEGALDDADARRLWNEGLADEARKRLWLEERELHYDLRRVLSPGGSEEAFLQGVRAELSTKRQDAASFAKEVAARAARRARRARGTGRSSTSRLAWGIAAAALIAAGLFVALAPSRPRVPEPVHVLDAPERIPAPPAPRSSERVREEAAPPKPPDPPQREEKPVPVPAPPPPTPPPPSPEPSKAPPKTDEEKPPPPEPVTLPTRSAIAKVEGVRGESFLLLEDQRTPAREGDPIFSGQGVRGIGEQALLAFRFQDGTRLQLSGDTIVRDLSESDPKTGKSLAVASGVLLADVPRQPAGRPLVIQTPHARAWVLGTQFILTVTPDATAVEVEEGRVRLVRNDGSAAEVGREQVAVAGRAHTPTARPLGNLLNDPSFERAGQGWMMFRPEGGLLAGRKIVPRGVRGAGHALEIEADRTFDHQVYQDVPAVAGSFYTLKGWIKSKDLRGGRVELLWLGATGLSDMLPPSSIVRTDVAAVASGASEWLKILVRFRAPAGTKAVRVRLATEAGSGFLWADDLRLHQALGLRP